MYGHAGRGQEQERLEPASGDRAVVFPPPVRNTVMQKGGLSDLDRLPISGLERKPCCAQDPQLQVPCRDGVYLTSAPVLRCLMTTTAIAPAGAFSAAIVSVLWPGLAVVAIMIPSATQAHGALSLS